jgi:hypothetical protein
VRNLSDWFYSVQYDVLANQFSDIGLLPTLLSFAWLRAII